MHDTFNRFIDSLEAQAGAWIHTHPVPFIGAVVLLALSAYAYKMYVADHRSH